MAAATANRGNAYLRQGMLDQALADFNEAIRLNPRLSNAFNSRGLLHENKQNLIQARSDYTEAIRLDPKNLNALANRGVLLTTLKEFDLAAKDFSTAIAINPGNTSTYVARGEAYLEKEDIESALQDFETALRLDSNNIGAFNGRARVWLAKRDWDRAIEAATVGIEKNPRSANLYATRGMAYRNKGEFNLSLMDYNESIKLFPSAGTYNNRSLLHSSRGELDLALADLNEAIRLAPNLDAAYSNRANIYTTKGEFHRALADLDAAIKLNPKSALTLYNRAITRQKLGGINASTLASADFSSARAIDPKIDEKIKEQERIERLAKQRYRLHQVDKLSPTQQAEQERRNSIVGLLFGIWLLVVAATAWLAKARGESVLLWGALALPLNIIALLLLWLRRPIESREDIRTEMNSRSAASNVPPSATPAQAATSHEGDWVWLAGNLPNSSSTGEARTAASEVKKSSRIKKNTQAKATHEEKISEQQEANLREGKIEGRPYRVLPDGRVEYESLTGQKTFNTEKEFFDFVGVSEFTDGGNTSSNAAKGPSFGQMFFGWRGRATRGDYLIVFFCGFAAMFLAIALTSGISAREAGGSIGFFVVLVLLVCFLSLTSVGVRRLHDLGQSGFFVLIPWALFFLVGRLPSPAILLILLVLVVAVGLFEGQPGPNRYGPDPLGREAPPVEAKMEVEEVPQPLAGSALKEGKTELGRKYWILSDGRVEYDSPSDRRIFKTEAEFREFIG